MLVIVQYREPALGGGCGYQHVGHAHAVRAA